jgi:hypothetical protein
MREQAPAAGTVICPGGHENDAASKFCAECGVTMGAAAVPAAPADDLGSMNANQLRAEAKRRGVDATGTKADLLGRLLVAA